MISMAELMTMLESYYCDDLLSYVLKFSKEWEEGLIEKEREGGRKRRRKRERNRENNRITGSDQWGLLILINWFETKKCRFNWFQAIFTKYHFKIQSVLNPLHNGKTKGTFLNTKYCLGIEYPLE